MGWLIDFILSAGGIKLPNEPREENDPTEENIGIHLISSFGHEYEHVSEYISEKVAVELIESLDWKEAFYQVVVTAEPGVSMEVGGSLNEKDGLCAVYRNRQNLEHLVTAIAPQSVGDMVSIVRSFINGDGAWKDRYRFQ